MKENTFNIQFYLLLLTASLIAYSGCQDEEEITRADFIGSYQISEVCNGVTDDYVLTIAAATDSNDGIVITNLWNWEEQMAGTVSGEVITIPSQIAEDVSFIGNGDLSGNTLTITYSAVDGAINETCVASGNK